jgi:hypothetical protein
LEENKVQVEEHVEHVQHHLYGQDGLMIQMAHVMEAHSAALFKSKESRLVLQALEQLEKARL